MNGFLSIHPAVSAFYFISVLIITMFTANPFLVFTALLGGILFFVKIGKNIKSLKEFGGYTALFVLISLTNPLFSHIGVTPLFFLNGNPVTLEAIFYGIHLAIMIIAVIYWFKCFNIIITEEKLLYLFGKISPKISLLISSALRFVPLLKTQAAKIRQTQKAMGLYSSEAYIDKLKGTIRVYSALISWSLENAIDTGASMKARGYGLKGRTYYSIYKFKKTDASLLVIIILLDTVIITSTAMGFLDFSFYPAIFMEPINIYSIFTVFSFAILSLLPFMLEVKEALQWKYYKSKI